MHFKALPAGDRVTGEEVALVALKAFAPTSAGISPQKSSEKTLEEEVKEEMANSQVSLESIARGPVTLFSG